MKNIVIGLVVGLVFGIATSATAATLYWSKSSPLVYSCEGTTNYAKCVTQSYRPRYSVIISKKMIALYFNGNNPVFVCYTGRQSGACEDTR